MNNEKLYPVYIILFSNDTTFGKIIRKATGSEYSHAVISLDPSLNDMYSFSDIPFTQDRLGYSGFVRESLWSPMFKKNRHFIVMVTFVNKAGIDMVKTKIDYFKKHYTEYDYNDGGLIKYYFKFKDTKNHDETKKMKWFCSEFVAGMLDAADVSGFKNILQSPEDLKNANNHDVIDLGKFTIPEFKESTLVRKTTEAKKTFIANHNALSESYEFDDYDDYEFIEEFSLKSIFDKEKKEKKKNNIKDAEISPYTQLIDWKILYNEYVKLFPESDPDTRFDLFELIIRKYLIPFKKNALNTTNELIKAINDIYKQFDGWVIDSVDVVNAYITGAKGKKHKTVLYPEFKKVTESYGDIPTMKKEYLDNVNEIRDIFNTPF